MRLVNNIQTKIFGEAIKTAASDFNFEIVEMEIKSMN